MLRRTTCHPIIITIMVDILLVLVILLVSSSKWVESWKPSECIVEEAPPPEGHVVKSSQLTDQGTSLLVLINATAF